MRVTLVGIGMDGRQTLTKEAYDAIDRADLLIGASRMLAPFSEMGKRQENCYDFRRIAKILQDASSGCDGCESVREAVVLLSGDTGFFSGAKKLLQYLENTAECGCNTVEAADVPDCNSDEGKKSETDRDPDAGEKDDADRNPDAGMRNEAECNPGAGEIDGAEHHPDAGTRNEMDCRHEAHVFHISVLPGISSLAALCAKSGLSYENMKVVSLHGREDHIAVNVLRNEQTFFLLGGKTDAAAVCRCLSQYGLGYTKVYVGENLGTETERITTGTAAELCKLKTDYLTVAIVCNPTPLRYLPCGINDDAFIRIIRNDEQQNAVPAGDAMPDERSRPGQKDSGAAVPAAEPVEKCSGYGIPAGDAMPDERSRPGQKDSGAAVPAAEPVEKCSGYGIPAGDAMPDERSRPGQKDSGATVPVAKSAAKFPGRTIPMTKSEVRAVALAKLRICENDVCWDVGCGTGSVSVEMALRCPGGMVYGYDKNAAAAELTMRNARKFSCDNIRAIVCTFPPGIPSDDTEAGNMKSSDAQTTQGHPSVEESVVVQSDRFSLPVPCAKESAEAQPDRFPLPVPDHEKAGTQGPENTDIQSDAIPLPVPDAVFIGGAGGRVDEIVTLAMRMNPAVRIVITAVSLETLEAARAALTRAFGGCGVTQLSAARAEQVGGFSMLKARNPIFILEGVRI